MGKDIHKDLFTLWGRLGHIVDFCLFLGKSSGLFCLRQVVRMPPALSARGTPGVPFAVMYWGSFRLLWRYRFI